MIRILTDSTADFSMADAAALGVAVVPLTVSFGDAHYQDGIDLPLERFYDMLAAADKLPTTSQPSPELFLSHLSCRQGGGRRPWWLCAALRPRSPAPCQSAGLARGRSGYEEQHLSSSTACTATLGLQLSGAARRSALRAEGLHRRGHRRRSWMTRPAPHLRLYAVVDTLKYLHKGRPPLRRGGRRRRPAGHQARAFSGRPRQAGHGGQSPRHARRICRHF